MLPHHVRLMELVFREAHHFNVIHFHCASVHFPLLRYRWTPTVTALHEMVGGMISNPFDRILGTL